MTATSTTSIDTGVVCRAARSLSAAARHEEALALLQTALETAATQVDEGSQAALLISQAEVVSQRDYRLGRRSIEGAALLDRVEALEPDAVTRWDVDMLRLRIVYAGQLVRDDGTVWIGPEGRDQDLVDRLCSDALRLRETAPDDLRRGWSDMCLGWFSDNLVGDRDAAPAHYQRALAVARDADDPMLLFEAQRHLGDHDHDRGDLHAALERWSESTSAAARAGHVAGVLAQQILLAVLARENGDDAGARLLAGEVGRWAEAVGAMRVALQSEGFLRGVDPTSAPAPGESDT